jgi:glutamine amidotransferase
MRTVAVVDVGSGNLRSVERALLAAQAAGTQAVRVVVTREADQVAEADAVVLPGQGAFSACMAGLLGGGLDQALDRAVRARGVPFLGICVGMQVLATTGLEHGQQDGLGWIGGVCRPLEAQGGRLPHMGWNDVAPLSDHPVLGPASVMYFAHSFVLDAPAGTRAAVTRHGEAFTAAVARDNLLGVQFHPEKSQAAGLSLLARFLGWRP